MSNILIACDTGEGQTEKIAIYVGTELAARGHDVTIANVSEAADQVGNADAILLGASIHMGAHQDSVVEFARTHRDAMERVPSAFFQVSLSSASPDPERQAEAERYVDEFREATGWHPAVVAGFAGAIRYSRYGFVKRFMMTKIAADATGDTDTSRDYEDTDWDDVDAFVDVIHAFVADDDESTPLAGDDAADLLGDGDASVDEPTEVEQ